MLYQIVSILLCLLGLGSAVTVFLLSLYFFIRQKRFFLLFYMAVSILFAGAMIRGLTISLSLLACSRIPTDMLLFSALLLVLHLYFIIDLFRSASNKKQLV